MFITEIALPTDEYLAALINPPPVDVDGTPFIFSTTARWDTTSAVSVFYKDSEARAWTAAEIAFENAGYASWSVVANIDFTQVTSESDADIVVSLANDAIFGEVDILADSGIPSTGISPIPTRYNYTVESWDSLDEGGDGRVTIIHEIGHSIGLEHPHDGTLIFGVPQGGELESGTNALNQNIWTVMGYVTGWTGQPRTGLHLRRTGDPNGLRHRGNSVSVRRQGGKHGRYDLHIGDRECDWHGLEGNLGYGGHGHHFRSRLNLDRHDQPQ